MYLKSFMFLSTWLDGNSVKTQYNGFTIPSRSSVPYNRRNSVKKKSFLWGKLHGFTVSVGYLDSHWSPKSAGGGGSQWCPRWVLAVFFIFKFEDPKQKGQRRDDRRKWCVATGTAPGGGGEGQGGKKEKKRGTVFLLKMKQKVDAHWRFEKKNPVPHGPRSCSKHGPLPSFSLPSFGMGTASSWMVIIYWNRVGSGEETKCRSCVFLLCSTPFPSSSSSFFFFFVFFLIFISSLFGRYPLRRRRGGLVLFDPTIPVYSATPHHQRRDVFEVARPPPPPTGLRSLAIGGANSSAANQRSGLPYTHTHTHTHTHKRNESFGALSVSRRQ